MTATRKPKATIGEKALITAHTRQLVALLKPRAEIQAILREKYGLLVRQADEYISLAKEEIVNAASASRQDDLSLAREQLNLIFTKAMNIQDYSRALAARAQLTALLGLNAPTKSLALDARLEMLQSAADKANVSLDDLIHAISMELAGTPVTFELKFGDIPNES